MPGELQRPDLYLVARILEQLEVSPEGQRPTALQLACGINYTQLERYLGFMASRRLLLLDGSEDGARTIRITEEGRRALEFLTRAIRDLLREEFDPRRARG